MTPDGATRPGAERADGEPASQRTQQTCSLTWKDARDKQVDRMNYAPCTLLTRGRSGASTGERPLKDAGRWRPSLGGETGGASVFPRWSCIFQTVTVRLGHVYTEASERAITLQ